MEESGPLPGDLFTKFFEFNPTAFAISRISDSKVVRVNEAFLQLFEFSDKSEVIGKSAAELNLMTNADDRERVVDMLKKGQRVVNLEGSIKTWKGNVKWISTSILVLTDEQSSYLVTVLLDITARKAAEDKVKLVNDELEQLVIKRTREAFENELEYHSLIEQATDAIVITDKEGRYVDVNPSACAMLGYTKEEFLKLTYKDIVDMEELKSKPSSIQQLMEGQSIMITRNFLRKDGTVVPVEVSARMLTNGRLLGMVRDISERKKSEEAIKQTNKQLEDMVKKRTTELEGKIRQLRESDDKFQKAFNASSAGITITRISDTRYVEVNDAFLRIIGYSRDEVLNHSAKELGLVIDAEKREEVWNEVREQGTSRHMELTIRRKSGDAVDILSSIETIAHNGEKFAITIIHDISELKRTQQDLEIVNKELEAFSYSVSHDLRAPLRSINGYAEIMKEDFGAVLGEQGNLVLTKISNNAVMMGRLVDDLLEFSRLGKKEISRVPLDTRALVERNIEALKAAATVQPEFIMGKFPKVAGDPSLINQVWFNLISNAIKYSSKKPQPVIEIGSLPGEKEVIFYVRDNGSGFSMEYAHKLFGVFQRLHKPSEFEGTGVGLAFVKRIVDKHGGRVWAQGKNGEGATFYFSIPVTG